MISCSRSQDHLHGRLILFTGYLLVQHIVWLVIGSEIDILAAARRRLEGTWEVAPRTCYLVISEAGHRRGFHDMMLWVRCVINERLVVWICTVRSPCLSLAWSEQSSI